MAFSLVPEIHPPDKNFADQALWLLHIKGHCTILWPKVIYLYSQRHQKTTKCMWFVVLLYTFLYTSIWFFLSLLLGQYLFYFTFYAVYPLERFIGRHCWNQLLNPYFFFAVSCAWMTSGVTEDFALSLSLTQHSTVSKPTVRLLFSVSARPTMRREECREQRSVWLKGDLRTVLAGTSLKPSKRRNRKRNQQLHGQDLSKVEKVMYYLVEKVFSTR